MIDSSIVKLCIEGDRKAQEKLYSYYAGRMKSVCLRYVKSKEAAEDVFQDGFVKVFLNLKKYNGEGSFDGWVRRIIVNTAIDTYKKNLRLDERSSYDDLREQEVFAKDSFESMHENDLLQILENLPDILRVIFNLYAIEGYSHKEIAEILNITESASKSQLYRSRKIIQQILFNYNSKA